MNALCIKYVKPLIKLAAVVLAVYIAMRFLLPFFAPFITAVVIAMVNEPVIRFFEKRLGLSRKIASFVSLLLTVSLLGLIATVGILKVYVELASLQYKVSDYINGALRLATGYLERITEYYESLPMDFAAALNEGLKSLAPRLQGIITAIAGTLMDALKSVPRILVFIAVTILSAYFISSDRRVIGSFLYRQLPVKWSKGLAGLKSNAFSALLGYFKALLILMLLTFIEAALGLFILGVDYALLLGLMVAVSDAIPVIGTGIVMVPWIICNIISGNLRLAFGLGMVYLLGIVMRQMLEPKIIGDRIGLHPLATLIAIYVGLELFGITGAVLGPIGIIIIKSLQKSGAIKIWND